MLDQICVKAICNSTWVYGHYVCIEHGFNSTHIIIPDFRNTFSDGAFERWYEVDAKTVCPCTGICDINGAEIYESDVIIVDNTHKAIVLWNEFDAVFIVNYTDESYHDGWDYLFNCAECEIIGNYIDEPNLFDE